MDKKMSVAKINELARNEAMKMVLQADLENIMFQVSGSKFMVDTMVNGEVVPVRIDFVVPKIKAEDEMQTAQDFADNFELEQADKARAKEEKAKAKEKKIARDKALREKKAKEKEEEGV